MRKIWSLKKKVSVRKKKTFWLWYHYRNWSLVLVPDTKIWFRSHTSKIFLTKNSWIQLLFWAEFLNNSAFTFKILTRDVQNHQFESADGNNIFGVFNFFVESRILTGKLVSFILEYAISLEKQLSSADFKWFFELIFDKDGLFWCMKWNLLRWANFDTFSIGYCITEELE